MYYSDYYGNSYFITNNIFSYDGILSREIICCIALILSPYLTLCQSIIPWRANVMMSRPKLPREPMRLVGHLGS